MNRIVFFLLFSSWPLSSIGADSTSFDRAQSLFQQRCVSAGERIHKVVKDVDGVLLLKLRAPQLNFDNQFRLDDPYGRDYLGDDYIKSFLQARHELPREIARLKGREHTPHGQIGYAFVEADNPMDGNRYRYTAVIDQPGKTDSRFSIDYARVIMTSRVSNNPSPRYGVTYEDISTIEDRQHWIASSSLKVLDLLTDEVIAERIGYMMDLGQGGTRGGRSPWLFAADNACPAFQGSNPALPQGGQTGIFVEKVLHPRPRPQLPSTE